MKKGRISKLALGLFFIFLVVQCTTQNGFSYDRGLSQFNLIGTKGINVNLTQVSGFGSNPGNLKMFVYPPPDSLSNAPLVVALHGCLQNAQDYANDTMWSSLSDQYKFAVLFPQTDTSNNSARCFNWFQPGNIARDSGEALSIKEMVDKMKSSYSIDSNRIYVTGLSAGAFMTVVMASTYPEIFKGAAPMAGGPYKCAATTNEAFSCMNPGVDKTGAQWATLIKSGYSGYTGKYPRISIWQGTSDTTVAPMNAAELMQGWANVLGLSETPSLTETIQGNTHNVFKDSSGVVLMETWDIAGMPHGITVDPDGTNGKAGGQTDTYSFDKNVWSSYVVAKFFGLDNIDTVAPTVSISSPSDGAGVSKNVTISASASDNVGVTKVEIYIDGSLKSTISAPPYDYTWNSAKSTNGNHNITAKAYDAAGNVGISSPISVRVSGGIEDKEKPTVSISSPSDGDSVSGSVTISANAKDNSGVVTKVEFYIDQTLKGTATSSPYNFIWDSSQVSDGNHTIYAEAYDPAGNSGKSSTINVKVSQLVYSEAAKDTVTNHYIAKRINVTQYTDLGTGTNYSGINPGKIRYGYNTSFYLYKLKSNGSWVTDQNIPPSQKISTKKSTKKK
jgi:poly(hydroxyalkanoate) depolymerase family esterase